MSQPAKELKNRAGKILHLLKSEYPEVKIALDFKSPFELLIATILSAQCTDARVNLVTKKLFKKYHTPSDYLKVEITTLEKDIFSTGFYRQKAKSITGCCKMLLGKYNGEVPNSFDALCELPGVGRKTASVVCGNAFGIPAIAVDTHVKRLSNLLGFVESDNPEVIENELKKLFAQEDWANISHFLATHGRNICIARRPKCNACSVAIFCPSNNKIK